MTLCEELGLDERVISLMQKLPYSNHARFPGNKNQRVHEFKFLHNARAVNYTDDEDLKVARDPENEFLKEEVRRLDYLYLHDVAFSLGEYRLDNEDSVNLDTRASTFPHLPYPS